MTSWSDTVMSYVKSVGSLELGKDRYIVEGITANDVYFDGNFKEFPTSTFNIENFARGNSKEISAKNINRKLKNYLALVGLKDGKILSDEQLEADVSKITGDKTKYKTLMKSLNIWADGSMSSEGLKPEMIFREDFISGVPYYVKEAYSDMESTTSTLNELFGESGDKQYNHATFVQGILGMPHLAEIIKGQNMTSEKLEKNLKYLNNIQSLVKRYPDIFSKSMSKMQSIISNYELREKEEDVKISPSDKEQYKILVDEVERFYPDSSPDIERLSKVLRDTKIRRGKLFYCKPGVDPEITNYSDMEKVGFSDLAGDNFVKNARKMKGILSRIENETTSGMFVILQGPPGNGKSDTILATLCNLPENAKGIVVEPDQGVEGTIDMVKSLSKLHPELYFITAIDDVDSIIKTREGYLNQGEVNTVLNLDSIYSRSKLPEKMILLGATNRPYAIDPAIIGRSGRARYILNYPNPDCTNREQIIAHLASKYNIGVGNIKEFAKSTEGFSGDDLAFIFKEAKEDELTSINSDVLKESSETIKERKQLNAELRKMFHEDITSRKKRHEKEEEERNNDSMYS